MESKSLGEGKAAISGEDVGRNRHPLRRGQMESCTAPAARSIFVLWPTELSPCNARTPPLFQEPNWPSLFWKSRLNVVIEPWHRLMYCWNSTFSPSLSLGWALIFCSKVRKLFRIMTIL